MSFDQLKLDVYNANMGLVEAGLITLTWGNASGADRKAGVVAIKPSGVPYDQLSPEDIVVLSLADGSIVDGRVRPSSDTPTHLHLYRSFQNIGGVVHTHSLHAVSFAQAQRDIICLGTTHADHFYGSIPVTRPLTDHEIAGEYELNTGKVIAECFATRGIDPDAVPGVLVASHGPFTWGANVSKAFENAVALEAVATMQIATFSLNSDISPVSQALLNKHYYRKHGKEAYYGQPK